MGGHAIKDARRITRAEFKELCVELDAHLKNIQNHDEMNQGYWPGQWHFVKAYEDKQDFGDIDIILDINIFTGGVWDWKAAILAEFQPIEHFDNHVLSINFKGVQVDFIPSASTFYEFCCKYHNWNDLGNLIGRTAHKMGLKFGHDGLWFLMRDPDNKDHFVGEILLTCDFKEALEFLGFDYARYAEGFTSLESIFKFVINGKYFNKTMFQLDQISHNSRTRDRKRKTYNAFLKYLVDNDPKDVWVFEGDKKQWIPKIVAAFPEFQYRYEDSLAKIDLNKKYKSIICGEIVMKYTGLRDQHLGQFMKTFKEKFDNEVYMKSFIIDLHRKFGDKIIKEMILIHHDQMDEMISYENDG